MYTYMRVCVCVWRHVYAYDCICSSQFVYNDTLNFIHKCVFTVQVLCYIIKIELYKTHTHIYIYVRIAMCKCILTHTEHAKWPLTVE